MLASILPGLRELRTPLTVGYAWILVGYLAFGYRLPKPVAAQGPLADLYAIVEVVTPAGLLVVASVAAYLLGIMVLPVTSAVTAWLAGWRTWVADGPLPWAIRVRFSAPDRVQEALRQIITDRLADRIRGEEDFRADMVRNTVEIGQSVGADIEPERLDNALRKSAKMRTDAITETLDVDGQVEDVQGELARMAERMRRADDRAGGEYDRLRSEAEFRAGMAWPLLGLFATLSVRASAWFAFGLLGVVLVLRSAAAARQEAQVQLTSVLAARRYEDRALQILDGVPVRQLLKPVGDQSLNWAIPAARQATALAVSPTGAIIAGGMNDGRIHLWDAVSGNLMLSLDGHHGEVKSLVFTPDGSRLISAADESAVLVWDVAGGQLLCRLLHEYRVTHIGFDPANDWVITATFWQLSWFSVPDGERQRRASLDMYNYSAMAVGADGTLTIAGDERILNLAAGGGEPKPMGGPHDGLNWVYWLGPQRLLSVSRKTMMIWEQGPSGVIKLTDPPHHVVVATGTETVVLAHGENEIAVAYPPMWTEIRTIGDHRSTVIALACSADGTLVVSASEEGAIVVWDVATARRLHRLSVTAGREATALTTAPEAVTAGREATALTTAPEAATAGREATALTTAPEAATAGREAPALAPNPRPA